MSPPAATSFGQVIEYIQDRLYLAAYTSPPSSSTPFPYPNASRSPDKRGKSRTQQTGGPTVHPPAYFSVDDTLLYNAFHHDFGPLHIGHLYRFAVQLHDILGDPANEGRGIVFWSKANAKSRANAACMLACYMVLIQSWPPHLALAPIAQADPPLMPFRDAGYSQADYTIGVQDVVYGVWKAKEEGLCRLSDFSLEEYERYERVDMGDFNWLTPSFLAFASPQHSPVSPILPSSPLFKTLPTTIAEVESASIPTPFKNVLCHFSTRNVGLVVRLNSELYSPSYFTALGINHLDMIFDDGTCPPLNLVKKFIKLAHETITIKHKHIAVHCKAGLGRTGCLIGAYLIYRHGFTANEIIAFMRFMRPGMVVGPQQHWLHLNQGTFREWWWADLMKEKAAITPSTPTKPNIKRRITNGQTSTPPNGAARRPVLNEIDHNESSHSITDKLDDNLPAPTPGQPRKTSRLGSDHPHRQHPYSRGPSETFVHDDDIVTMLPSTTKIVTKTKSLKRASAGSDENESDGTEDEWQLRMLARRTASRSPRSSEKRAVTYTATTTRTETTFSLSGNTDGAGSLSDAENWLAKPKTPGREKSGSGAMVSVGKVRGSPRRGTVEGKVRKTSTRIGSASGTRKI